MNLAASQGDEGAQYFLGVSYLTGQDIPQDQAKAYHFLKLAAEGGIPGAQIELGKLYYAGHGVPQDYVQAYKWWNIAASKGQGDAAEMREIIKTLMTPTQIAESQRLSTEFRPKKQDQSSEEAKTREKTEIKGSGTGFYVTTDGYLLTAYHVVKDADSVQLWTNKTLKPAMVIRADIVNDIALMKADCVGCEALPIHSSQNVAVGQEVFTLGYPNIQLQGTECKYTYGHINSLSGIADDPRMFQISAAVQPGNSGGPLLDSEGMVVGLVVSKLDEIATARRTGSLPQNVNYALKSSFNLSFLEGLPELRGKLLLVKREIKPQPQIVKKSVEAVVMVLCY